MNKKEFLEKTGIDSKALDGFSEETLNEMAMDAIEGGGNNGLFCKDNSGNCVAGCACSGGGY